MDSIVAFRVVERGRRRRRRPAQGVECPLMRDLLAADLAHQRVRGARRVFVHLLAFAGLPLWLATLWPSSALAALRSEALAAWATLAVAAGVLAAVERVACHKLQQLILPPGPSRGEGAHRPWR